MEWAYLLVPRSEIELLLAEACEQEGWNKLISWSREAKWSSFRPGSSSRRDAMSSSPSSTGQSGSFSAPSGRGLWARGMKWAHLLVPRSTMELLQTKASEQEGRNELISRSRLAKVAIFSTFRPRPVSRRDEMSSSPGPDWPGAGMLSLTRI